MYELGIFRHKATVLYPRLSGNGRFHKTRIKTDTIVVDEEFIHPADDSHISVFIDIHQIIGIQILFAVDVNEVKKLHIIQLSGAQRL